MRLFAVTLLLFALPFAFAEELRLEDASSFGFAQFVEWGGECGFLTPAHVFDSLQRPFRIAGEACHVFSVRRFPRRDLVFFTADVFGKSPLKIPMRASGGGETEFRLKGPAVIQPDAWQGKSGALGHDADGRPGLFIGLDRVTHERIFVRIDNL